MYTRYSFVTSPEKVESQFGVILPAQFRLSYNIAATHHAYVITNENMQRLQYITWGLIPHWSNDGKNEGTLISARKENITSTASFRIPIRERRCIVLADSFYVWKRMGSIYIPNRVVCQNGELMALAGIWDMWQSDDYAVKSFSIITAPAGSGLEVFTDRMPILLNENEIWKTWLSNIPLAKSMEILNGSSGQNFDVYQVTQKINSTDYKGRDVHDEEIDLPKKL